LHVGGARTALFNWLLARKTKGKFLIRVEDTDEARSTRQSEDSILNDLKWMNLHWDEGPGIEGPCSPYRQSERKAIYKKFAEQLIAQGNAYRCFCTEEELDKKRAEAEAAGLDPKYDGTWRDADPKEVQRRLDNNEPYTVRFRVPGKKVVFIDDVVRGRVTWDAEAMLGDFIILRSSGMPVYNFCVAVDDATMGITHVIRAEEHLSNTLRQLLILEALNYKPPTYAHCSLILGSDRSKLSKRHGATSVTQFAEQGFLPEAMMNYLANLGWNDGTPKEIYTPQELVDAFDMSRIIKSAAVFDMDKLKWINGQHIRLKSLDEIQPLVIAALQKSTNDQPAILPATIASSEQATNFLNLATKIAQRDMELIAESRHFVGRCLQYDLASSVNNDEHVSEVLNDDLAKIITAIRRDYDAKVLPTGHEAGFPELWKTYVKNLGKELALKGKNLFHPVRFAITGLMSGPDIGDQMQLLAYAEGVVNPDYKIVPLVERMKMLASFNIAEAKVTAEAATVRRAEEKKAKEEAAAAATAEAAANVDASASPEPKILQEV
jgi:glutamyl-tRNA synthetase